MQIPCGVSLERSCDLSTFKVTCVTGGRMFLPEVITVPSLLRALEIISEDNRGGLGTLPLRALFAKVTLKRLRLHLVIPDRQVIGSLRCLPTLTDLEVFQGLDFAQGWKSTLGPITPQNHIHRCHGCRGERGDARYDRFKPKVHDGRLVMSDLMERGAFPTH